MASDDDKRSELQALLPRDISVQFSRLFPTIRGFFGHRRDKKRAELLAKAAPALRRFLDDDEEVVYVSSGIRSFLWEMMLAGGLAYYVNHTSIVVTNKRMLLLHTDRKGLPKSYANEIPLGAVKKGSAGWLFGYLKLKLASGAANFTRIPRREARALAKSFEKNPQASGRERYLCPSCGTPSTEHDWPCPRCGADALSPRVAAVRSAVLPGLGDWMLGHRLPAVLEMFGSAIGWVILIAVASSALTGGARIADVFLWLFLVGTGHIMDALVTRAQARKGLYSVDGQLPTDSKPLTPVPTAVGGSTTPTATR